MKYLININIKANLIIFGWSFSVFACMAPDNDPRFFEQLCNELEEHKNNLIQLGLHERTRYMHIEPCSIIGSDKNIDLTPFKKNMPIPSTVVNFDRTIKNTIITTDPIVPYNKPEDLQLILGIRLYPPLRKLILEHGIEIFLGNLLELQAYYLSEGKKLLYEFHLPTSGRYFLARGENGKLLVILGGLVSGDNLIAQLLTLKLAGIEPNTIKIIGESTHFNQLIHSDITKLKSSIPCLKDAKYLLIIAGCGMRETINQIILDQFPQLIGHPQSFEGDIISLSYLPIIQQINGIKGIISVDLKYGDSMFNITKALLDTYYCPFVFSGSAGGYIPVSSKPNPPIGTRIPIDQVLDNNRHVWKLDKQYCMNDNNLHTKMHLQIPSIFLETYPWLDWARLHGTSVDVETGHIIRAIVEYNQQYPLNPVKADCGYFVSDYVGEKPLREYKDVFANYKPVLIEFISKIISK